MRRDVPFILMILCFCVTVLGTVAFFGCCQGCSRPPPPPSPQHQADLGACFISSRAYRDAGFDAEMAAWKECADKADEADRQRGPR